VLDEQDEIDDDDDEEYENGDEEEEKFDIDDSANPSVNDSRAPSTTTSASPSGHNTPAHPTFPSKGDLSMTSIAQSTSPGSPDPPAANGTSDIDMHEDGYRDNIHSPKSLTHGAKSAIPKDRDVDSMRTPRAHDAAHPHIRHHHHHHHHHHHTQSAAAHARLAHPQGSTHSSLNPGPLPHVPRLPHLRARAHRPSRSADFGTENRAFAVWGQDESDSNTDSEA
jgi:NAD+ kinase